MEGPCPYRKPAAMGMDWSVLFLTPLSLLSLPLFEFFSVFVAVAGHLMPAKKEEIFLIPKQRGTGTHAREIESPKARRKKRGERDGSVTKVPTSSSCFLAFK